MTVSKHFFIIAGEHSGDIHGGMLMHSMLNIDPNCHFLGIGGPSMEKQGIKSLFPINKMAVVGFVEVIKHLDFFKRVESSVLSAIDNSSPDRIILIDFPGFNLRIAKKIKERYNKIPITYYISPQIWAWKENRIKIIKKYIDQMLVILPFEKGWYAKRGMDVDWVGHPYLDHQSDLSKEELRKHYNIDPDEILLTLFPGSRQQEVDKHIPLLIKACQLLLDKNDNLKIAIGLAPGVNIKENYNEVSCVEKEDSHRLLSASDILITASGTATLEAAILGIPMAVVYKLNIFSWLLSRLLVKIDFIALPNIIFKKKIVPEFIQSNAKPADITEYIQKIIDDSELRVSIGNQLSNIKDILGDSGASDRAAQKILDN